jgi:Ca2+-binding EF-hand superfamily protein
MGVAPLILFCAFLLTTLQVNAFPVPTDHVTDREATALAAAELFNVTDANQDGQLSFEEFSNIPSGGPVNTEFRQLMFAYADVNRDGALSLDEFTNFAELLATDPSQRGDQELSRIMNANEWFKVYDEDQDARISPQEAIAMVDQQHSTNKSLSKLATLVLFDKADGNQDSRLSFLEFVMFITSVEDTLKRAEDEDAQLPTADATTTEETVTDYMEPVEGVTGSITVSPSDVVEPTDSQSKTVPAEWAPFIQTTTEITKLQSGEAIDTILLPPVPSMVGGTSDELNSTAADTEGIIPDPTTMAPPEEEPKAETKPFVAGGDFMKDPPESMAVETIPDSTTAATEVTESSAATETTPATEPTPATHKTDDSSELVADGKQIDFEKTHIDDKMTSAEQMEVAALMNRMAQETQAEETTTSIAEDSSTAAAPFDLLEEAPSVESSSTLVPPTSDPAPNKAILEMADQDNDNLITMAEAFDFVRVFIKVNNYLLLESLFVQNDQDGDRKLNPDEYVAFLKALVDSCSLISDDTCDAMKLATFGDQTQADTSAIPIMIKEQPSDPPIQTDVLATSPESVKVTSESPSSPTEIPILIIEEPQESTSEKPEELPKVAILTSEQEAALEELFAEAAKQGAITEEDQSATTAATDRSEAEFIPIIVVGRPQEEPRVQTPTAEQQAILAGLFLQESGETKPDKSRQSAETKENMETTTNAHEDEEDTLQLLGFGQHTGEWATTSIAPPVMSEESEQNLQALSDAKKWSNVEVIRVNEGDYGYFGHVYDSALYLFLMALVLVLLLVVLAVVVTRRFVSRREKIYTVS